MNQEKIIIILAILTAAVAIFKHKYLGRISVEQRKKLNRILPFPQPERAFNEEVVGISQLMFLLFGIIIFVVGVIKLFS